VFVGVAEGVIDGVHVGMRVLVGVPVGFGVTVAEGVAVGLYTSAVMVLATASMGASAGAFPSGVGPGARQPTTRVRERAAIATALRYSLLPFPVLNACLLVNSYQQLDYPLHLSGNGDGTRERDALFAKQALCQLNLDRKMDGAL